MEEQHLDGKPIKIIFSDLDGTLVHYPKHFSEFVEVVSTKDGHALLRHKETKEERVCKVLKSLTGGDAYISHATIELVQKLRDAGCLFVVITGSRSSTYSQRRKLLPKADFELFENGGRCVRDGVVDVEWSSIFDAQVGETKSHSQLLLDLPPAEERQGPLWDVYRDLTKQGWKTDARDYLTNFRVDVAKSEGKTAAEFEEYRKRLDGLKLSCTFNLGKADIYPKMSGKANAAKRILDIVNVNADQTVALFDDDNDLDLGHLTGRALLPSVTSDTVYAAMQSHPKWKLMDKKAIFGTEQALQLVLDTFSSTKVAGEKALASV